MYLKSSFPGDASACTVVCVKGEIDEEVEGQLEIALPGLFDHPTSVRMFYRPSHELEGT